jgi:hypothetical protein
MSALPWPALPPLPDAERLVCDYLRADPRVAALVGERVYTAFPAQAGGAPLLLVQRVGGIPPFPQPLIFDQAGLQLDAYGGSKAKAHELAATARAVLGALQGTVQPQGVVSGVDFGSLRWQPDETYDPPRARYQFDLQVYVKTAAAVLAAARTNAPAVLGAGNSPAAVTSDGGDTASPEGG